jgi:hypothetical protein
MPLDTEHFFKTLPELRDFGQVLTRDQYTDAPDSWHVVISDVRGSTRAIEAGRYREVNALGVASIIAVRNATKDLDLPYVFGGDGATLLIPGSRLDAVSRALRGARELAQNTFDLDLRVACVPVAALRERGHAVRVARYRLSEHIALAMFSGDGFHVAERWAKDEVDGARHAIADGPADADFEGFECSWQPVQSQRGEIMCLIVVARSTTDIERERTYRAVLEMLESTLEGDPRTPVARQSLQLLSPGADHSIEARIRSQRRSGPAYDRAAGHARRRTRVGRGLLALGLRAFGFDGKRYLDEFVAHTDFRKFDETLRMVLDVTTAQGQAIERALQGAADRGELAYGIHRSETALATCMVKAYQGDHVHFVDGSDGGYALAARQLKSQLAGKG